MNVVKLDLNDEDGLAKSHLNSRVRLINKTVKNNNFSIALQGFGINK